MSAENPFKQPVHDTIKPGLRDMLGKVGAKFANMLQGPEGLEAKRIGELYAAGYRRVTTIDPYDPNVKPVTRWFKGAEEDTQAPADEPEEENKV